MSKKRRDEIEISFIGENSHDVTGSSTLIKYKDKKILLEYGMYQSNNLKEDYKINSRALKFRPKDIDYIFINHSHIDHMGLIPKLYKHGCKAEIICTHNTLLFLDPLLEDSAYINQKDSDFLSRQLKKNIEPIYESTDIKKALCRARGYAYNKVYKLDDTFSFKFIPAGHILGSSQLILYIKKHNQIKKILYTSDIGNIKYDKPFVEKFQMENSCNLVIGECTYGSKVRSAKQKDRINDINKIKTLINDVCFDNKGRILIPCFALDRTQYMLKILYDLYSKNDNFNIPIVIDSPLAVKLTKLYKEGLNSEDKKIYEEMLNWENLIMISDPKESMINISNKSPKIVLSSSGMLTAGRSINYLKEYIKDPKSALLFCGFAANNSLAALIKNNKEKIIKIDNKEYKNNMKIVDLKSFSSHMQYDDLLNYYTNINCENICLVHGNMASKIDFCEDLKNELFKSNKTTNVTCVEKDMKIIL